jgi:hypothetical protein
MDPVVLLSEIHPLGVRTYNPLEQASRWHGLLSPEDLAWVQSDRPSFPEAVGRIEQRCREQGKVLLIRDWSHLDFTGVPYTRPVYRSRLAEALAGRFTLQRYCTVRHPMDQWISLSSFSLFRERLSPARFITGALHFARMAQEAGYQRYEDLTEDAEPVLKAICRGLDIEFDAAYAQRWHDYGNITGDVLPGRAGREIETLPRQQTDPAAAAKLRGLPEYTQVLELLRYDPDSSASRA